LLVLISLLFQHPQPPQRPCCLFTLSWSHFGPSSILLASIQDKIMVSIFLPGKLWNVNLSWFNYHLSQYVFLKLWRICVFKTAWLLVHQWNAPVLFLLVSCGS
jgi:hypothetical protein